MAKGLVHSIQSEPSPAKRRVIIIGAGLGGLALACRLAKNGYLVDVYEKNATAGGRVAQTKVKGYTIDLGPTFLLMPAEFDELFTYCGASIRDFVEYEALSPLYRLHYWDGTHLDIHSSLPDMKRELERYDLSHAEKNFQGLLDFLAHEQEKYPTIYKRFIIRPADSLLRLLLSFDFPKLFQLDGFHSMWENADEFFDDAKLNLAFSFQSMYVGESPFVAPATYSIIPFVEMTQGVWYPKQGMRGLMDAVEKLAKKMSVHIHYKQSVTEILIEEGKAKGIRMKSGKEEYAPIVISNLDLPATYSKLIPSPHRKKYTDEKLSKLKYGSSAFMVYLGVDKDYSQLQHHNVFFSEDYAQNFKEIFDERVIPTDPSLYVNVPTRTNPKLAPKGKHLLYVLVPVSYSAKKDGVVIDWNKYKESFMHTILDTLEKKGLTDLKKHVKMVEVFTPTDWEFLAGMHLGSTFGLSPIFFQSSVFRPSQKSEDVQNLYFVGASTHPGSGMPMVLISARTAEILIQNNRNGK